MKHIFLVIRMQKPAEAQKLETAITNKAWKY